MRSWKGNSQLSVFGGSIRLNRRLSHLPLAEELVVDFCYPSGRRDRQDRLILSKEWNLLRSPQVELFHGIILGGGSPSRVNLLSLLVYSHGLCLLGFLSHNFEYLLVNRCELTLSRFLISVAWCLLSRLGIDCNLRRAWKGVKRLAFCRGLVSSGTREVRTLSILNGIKVMAVLTLIGVGFLGILEPLNSSLEGSTPTAS